MDGIRKAVLGTDLGPTFWIIVAIFFGTWAVLALKWSLPSVAAAVFAITAGFALGVAAEQIQVSRRLRDLLADDSESLDGEPDN